MSKIAVVGMSCLFPGAESTDAFWELLKSGRDCRENASDSDFGIAVDSCYNEIPTANKIYCLKGGFIRDFHFDGSGFEMPPELLDQLDDVFKWPLHVTRAALQDAGLWKSDKKLGKAGVIMGNYAFPTKLSNGLALPLWYKKIREHLGDHLQTDLPCLDEENQLPNVLNRFVGGLPATVVSQACGMKGPAYTIDAACSSALYAIKMSSYYLRSGKADVMLAGGVCAPDPWLIHTSFSDLRAYPENGHSQPFSNQSTGIQTGQGSGMVVLKRLEDALADGDKIYCTIEGLGISNDGAGKHLLSPNPQGQILAYQRAYEESNVKLSEIDYIECHATGTPLGDQTELNSLESFFGEEMDHIKLGSVKGTTGHLLTVAGLTSLVKLILSLRHQALVPTPNVTAAECRVSQGGTINGNSLLTNKQPWPASDVARFAAVSAFGFGGTNAHLVLSDRKKVRADVKRMNEKSKCLPAPSVAIVGMGAHFGEITSLSALEKKLFSGSDAINISQNVARNGLLNNPGIAGAYVESVDIDPLAFRIPPAELKHFNQQQLLMLKVADDALVDAGLNRKITESRNISVILVLDIELTSHLRRAKGQLPQYVERLLAAAGIEKTSVDFDHLVKMCGDSLHGDIASNEVLSYIGNIMASRISSLWNFNGASFTLSGDGNGVCNALELARMMLAEGDTDGVLVGAVDLPCIAEEMELYQLLHQRGDELFSNNLNLPWGEGAGAVLLMRDADAVKDGLRRYATLPEDKLPEDKVTQDAFSIGLVQLAGLVNSDTLTNSLSEVGPDDDPAAIACLTPSLGYSRIAAPIAGLIAASLSLYHRYLPAQNKLERSFIQQLQVSGAHSQLFYPTETYPWFKPSGKSRAARVISATSNGELSNLLLQEADWPNNTEIVGRELRLVPIVAADRNELQNKIQQLVEKLSANSASHESDMALIKSNAWKALSDKPSQCVVAAIVADNLSGLKHESQLLLNYLSANKSETWKTPVGSYLAAQPQTGSVAFVYPGGFNSYPYLANGLLRLFPSILRDFEEKVESVGVAMSQDKIFPRRLGIISNRELMNLEQSMLQDIPAMLTNGTSLAIMYTRILRDLLQVSPAVGFGYSLGESSMLFANGVWPAEGRHYDQLAKSPLFNNMLTGRRELVRTLWGLASDLEDDQVWVSYVLLVDRQRVEIAILNFDRLYVTHINTSNEVLVAGSPLQMQELIKALGCEAIKTPTAHVLHAEVVRSVQSEFAALNSFPSTLPLGNTQLISAGHYRPLERYKEDDISDLNSDSLCREVDFPRLMDMAYDLGARTFIEVGPGRTCCRWVATHLAKEDVASLAVTQRGKDDLSCFEQLLAQLISLQVPMDYSLFASSQRQLRNHNKVTVGFAARTKSPVFINTDLVVKPKIDLYLVTNSAAKDGHSGVKELTKQLRYWKLNASTIDRRAVHLASKASPSSAPPSTHYSSFERKPVMQLSTYKGLLKKPFSVFESVGKNLKLMAASQGVFLNSQQQLQKMVFEYLDFKSSHSEALDTHYQHKDKILSPTNKVAEFTTKATPIAVKKSSARAPLSNALVMNEQQLLAFAEGKVVDAFGEKYAEIDQYPVRVRLPSPPYFFVSRVTQIKAEFGKYEKCMLTTEYDIPKDAWYLVDGVMPPGVAVEAGQSDLLLISYLGIDFENKGERMYRLLDGKLAFVGDLPRAGQTLRFDIHINSYVRQGGVLLFFFSYEGYVDGKLALRLERGCAGFFTQQQLAQGQGLLSHPQNITASLVKPMMPCTRTQLDAKDLAALCNGDVNNVFHQGALPQGQKGVKLPPEMLLMVDCVTVLNRVLPSGFLQIEAFKKLDPQGWYFKSHFVDDPVLPGSLVAEGATQLLKIHMMSIGLHQCFAHAEFQPIPELLMDIRVRGQITPNVETLRYVVEIFESGFLPRPYVKANVVVYDGDRPLVAVENLGLCLKEIPGQNVYPRYGETDYFSGRVLQDGTSVVLNEFHLAHAAKGDLKTAMGREFEIYGDHHHAPYIPNGDFQFVDRAVTLTGDRGKYQNGSIMVTEYDVPQDAWYFQQNSYPDVPNCVYLESALQASILLGYFLGATLNCPEKELFIRNLDGKATYRRVLDLRGKTIRHKETLLSTSALNGSVLQNFRFELTADGELIYEGESLFGYFPREALSNQLGLDNGNIKSFWHEQNPSMATGLVHFNLNNDEHSPLFASTPTLPFYRLPNQHLHLLHQASLVPDGGKYGKGYVHGYRAIHSSDWYFKFHFYRDPVMPGSLGLEAFVEAIQLFAIHNKLGLERFKSPRFGVATDVTTSWKYRGQLLMTDPHMNIEVHIKEIRNEANRIVVIADADLFKDHLRIYQTEQMAIAITEGN
jgi:PfaB family protein